MSSSMPLSRRSLFKMSSGAAMFLLPILKSSRANAATGVKRMVFFHTPLGTVRTSFQCMGTETSFTLSPILSPLSPVKDKLLVIEGLKKGFDQGTGGGNHQEFNAMLTGRSCNGDEAASQPSNISVDQFLRNKVPDTVRYKSLELFYRVVTPPLNVSRSMLSARGPGDVVVPEGNPQKAFDRMFAGVTSGGTAPDPAQAALRARRRSILDAVTKEVTGLQPQLTGFERSKLDQHLTSIRELERQLQEPAVVAGCTVPARPGTDTAIPAVVRAHLDVIVNAMACDLIRVAVLCNGAGRQPVPWTGLSTSNWHDSYSHDASGYPAHTTIHKWYVEQFAYLAQAFQAKGMLDDSALVLFSEQGSRGGSFDVKHSGDCMPYVVAGSCGGYFKQNRLVSAAGHNTSEFLFNCIRAMGHPDTQMGNVSRAPIAALAV